nr:MAG TPA: putative tail component [Caudoviricetes sp.]
MPYTSTGPTARFISRKRRDMAGDVTVKQDNTEQVIDGIDSAIGVALEKIGLLAENYAAKKCPVDTGNLRASITHEVDAGDNAVYIGTNVEYAPYVELGTSRQKAQPFLRPAASEHGAQYRQVLKKALGGSS